MRTRFSFGQLAAAGAWIMGTLLLVVGAIAYAAGKADVTRIPAGNTGFTDEGQPWPSLEPGLVTGAKVEGELTYAGGATRKGTAYAEKALGYGGFISDLPNRPDGSQAGQWNIHLSGRMTAEVKADPYFTGTGGYEAVGKAKLSYTKPDGSVVTDPQEAKIKNEDDTDSAQSRVDWGTSATPIVHDGNSIVIAYACRADGDITTNRPEATIKVKVWMQQAYIGSAAAYDATDPGAPLMILVAADGSVITAAYYELK